MDTIVRQVDRGIRINAFVASNAEELEASCECFGDRYRIKRTEERNAVAARSVNSRTLIVVDKIKLKRGEIASCRETKSLSTHVLTVEGFDLLDDEQGSGRNHRICGKRTVLVATRTIERDQSHVVRGTRNATS